MEKGAVNREVAAIIERVKGRDPEQINFHQAFEEVVLTLKPVFEKHPKYLEVIEKIAEPERVIQFRVPWLSDDGKWVVNRGYRVQYNSAIGPYKGGLRFDGSRVNLGVLKFLGFEHTFKNALTGLPMGGGKGGSNFNPKGKSDNEVMKFCQSFMSELFRHIGSDTDVPSGDIGVGGREIGFLYGQYKRLKNVYDGGTLTGKGRGWGGSLIRPEATGYGSVWFAEEMLKTRNDDLKGKKAIVSGSGNVSQYTCEKLLQLGAFPMAVSDRSGVLIFNNGISVKDLEVLMDLKNVKRTGLVNYPKRDDIVYHPGKSIWDCDIKAELAFPSATQNEIDLPRAERMKKNGVFLVSEGANMPSNAEAIHFYITNKFLYGPAKAANCGGVSTSGLEMTQNSMRCSWTREEVTQKLHQIMINCHKLCFDTAKEYGYEGNLALGANIAGFLKVANAMLDQGHV